MLCNACHIVHAIIPISNNGQHQQLHNISLNQESINLPNLECMRPWVQLQTGCRRCMWSLFKNTCNMLQLYFMAKCNESLKPKAKGEQSKSTCLLHQVPSERLQRLSRKKHWIISTQLYVFWSQFCVWFHLKLFFWAWDLSPVRRSFHVVVFFFTVTLLFLMFVCTSLVFSCVPGIVFVPKCWLWSLCLEQKTSLYNITISIYIYIISIASPSKPSKPCRDRTQPILQLNVPL